MKIGIVSQSYYPRPGGVSEVVHYNACGLRALGHEVKIITTHFDGPEEEDPNILRIGHNMLVPMNGAWVNMTIGIGLAKKLRSIFDREKFDIIHTHCPLVPTLPLLTISVVRPEEKLVGTFHAASDRNLAYAIFKKPLSRRVSRLDRRLAVSEAARKFANFYFPGHYEIIPNGVDCSRFRPDLEPIDRFRDDKFNILFVGRLDRRKGASYLLRALPIIASKLSRRVRLMLVGEKSIRSLLCPKPSNLHGAEISWIGYVPPPELPRYYATADVFCSPAIGQESFGIVLLEALACGRPVVASDIEGYRGLIENGTDGLLAAPRDPASIAAAISRVASDESLQKKLSQNARAKALAYDWPTIVKKLEAIYNDVLS